MNNNKIYCIYYVLAVIIYTRLLLYRRETMVVHKKVYCVMRLDQIRFNRYKASRDKPTSTTMLMRVLPVTRMRL